MYNPLHAQYILPSHMQPTLLHCLTQTTTCFQSKLDYIFNVNVFYIFYNISVKHTVAKIKVQFIACNIFC